VEHRLVVAHDPRAEGLAEVAVEVDHAHPSHSARPAPLAPAPLPGPNRMPSTTWLRQRARQPLMTCWSSLEKSSGPTLMSPRYGRSMSAVTKMTRPTNRASIPAIARWTRRLFTSTQASSTALTRAPTQINAHNSVGKPSEVTL